MAYWVYILQSLKDHSFYIGYSSDVDRRLVQHNTSNSGYTARKQPWVLVHSEMFISETEAIRRERFIKKQKDKAFIIRLIVRPLRSILECFV